MLIVSINSDFSFLNHSNEKERNVTPASQIMYIYAYDCEQNKNITTILSLLRPLTLSSLLNVDFIVTLQLLEFNSILSKYCTFDIDLLYYF